MTQLENLALLAADLYEQIGALRAELTASEQRGIALAARISELEADED